MLRAFLTSWRSECKRKVYRKSKAEIEPQAKKVIFGPNNLFSYVGVAAEGINSFLRIKKGESYCVGGKGLKRGVEGYEGDNSREFA